MFVLNLSGRSSQLEQALCQYSGGTGPSPHRLLRLAESFVHQDLDAHAALDWAIGRIGTACEQMRCAVARRCKNPPQRTLLVSRRYCATAAAPSSLSFRFRGWMHSLQSRSCNHPANSLLRQAGRSVFSAASSKTALWLPKWSPVLFVRDR